MSSRLYGERAVGYMGGLCDFGVTPVPIGFGFGTALGLGLGLKGPDLGLGLDNKTNDPMHPLPPPQFLGTDCFGFGF